MRLANESDKTAVRASPSQTQVDQLEEWLLEKPIPYISNDNFSQDGIFDYWNGKLPGHGHVKRTYPDVVRMWRQFHVSHSTITDYQMIVSNDLIIKSFDTGFQLSV